MGRWIQNLDEIIIRHPNWINLLPPLCDKHVLKLGAQNTDNLVAITSSAPKSLSCVGHPPKTRHIAPLTYYNSFDDVGPKTFDVIIVDEPVYLAASKSLSDIRRILSRISQLLRDNGILLLSLPDRVTASLKCRYWVDKALPDNGFTFASYYFCEPSAEQPLSITPYSAESSRLEGRIRNVTDHRGRWMTRLKNVAKTLLFYTAHIYNPLRGLIVVAAKDGAAFTSNEVIFHQVQTYIENGAARRAKKPLLKLVDRGWKHVMFAYDGTNAALQFVAKIGHKATGMDRLVRKEYDNLMVLSRCKYRFQKRGINIPEPIHYMEGKEKCVAIQSAVDGMSVGSLMDRYIRREDRKAVMSLIDELVEMEVFVRTTCTKTISNDLAILTKDYLANYLGVRLDFESCDPDLYSHDVQHGDFTTVNVYVNPRQKKWGIIDWEGMARGYPHLLDLFCCITSVGFTRKRRGSLSQDEISHQSFCDTYFGDSWFSDYVAQLVKRYCHSCQCEMQEVFRNFTAYLLYQCNRYRLKEEYPPYQRMYEKMLMFAIRNEDRFVVK